MNVRYFLSVFIITALCTSYILPDTKSVLAQPTNSSSLSSLQNTYLTNCDTLELHSKQISYQLSRISFSSLEEAKQYADSLQVIEHHLNTELSQCARFSEISGTLSTMNNLFDITLKSTTVERSSRSLFFYFEEVPIIYQDDIQEQIVTQVEQVERLFEEDLNLSVGNQGLVFFITNRRIMEPDVGGANIGSFTWLPLEYSLGYGQQWPDGVRESTVRHEIVHAFMNHVSQSPIEHAYPKVFIEGIALYLSDNRIIEFHRRTRVRLSDEYIEFLRTFEYMEEQAGRDAVLHFIRDMLTGQQLSFSAGFKTLTQTDYATYLASRPSLIERTARYVQQTLRIPARWQRYISVFGALSLIALLFLTVRLPVDKREEVRRNISVAFLTFVILSFLTQGQLVEMSARNYLPFILLALFSAVLLRGYPSVHLEDLMEDLREQSERYQGEEED